MVFTERNIATRRRGNYRDCRNCPLLHSRPPHRVSGLPRSVHLDLNLAESDLASISVADPSPHSRRVFAACSRTCTEPLAWTSLPVARVGWFFLGYYLPASTSRRRIVRVAAEAEIVVAERSFVWPFNCTCASFLASSVHRASGKSSNASAPVPEIMNTLGLLWLISLFSDARELFLNCFATGIRVEFPEGLN